MRNHSDLNGDAFTIERHGELTIIAGTPAIESIDFGMDDSASKLLMNQVHNQDNPQIVFDLSQVKYVGSNFLGLLLRCWKATMAKGGSLVLAGPTEHAKELLHVTSLDFVLPIYSSRREAIDALLSD